MIRRVLAAGAAPLVLCLQAAVAAPAGLPPLEQVEAAIDAAPSVAAARAEIVRARAAADRLRIGDYELELTAGLARRSVEADGDYAEWSGGIRRAVRWPDKRTADVTLARLEAAIAETDFEAAWRETALDWAALWSEWRASAALAAMAEDVAADAEALAQAESRRVDLGAGRALGRESGQRGVGAQPIAIERAPTPRWPDSRPSRPRCAVRTPKRL